MRKRRGVSDVHSLPGHNACDPRSRSEVVAPFFTGEHPLGVFDLYSPRQDRFSAENQTGMEALAMLLPRSTDTNRC